jgi:hypothetical protein
MTVFILVLGLGSFFEWDDVNLNSRPISWKGWMMDLRNRS